MDTIINIWLTCDARKNAANLAKHGVALTDAADIEWRDAVSWPDARRDDGEERMCAIACIGVRLHVVVYMDRADVRRIISLRKANLKEIKRYAET